MQDLTFNRQPDHFFFKSSLKSKPLNLVLLITQAIGALHLNVINLNIKSFLGFLHKRCDSVWGDALISCRSNQTLKDLHGLSIGIKNLDLAWECYCAKRQKANHVDEFSLKQWLGLFFQGTLNFIALFVVKSHVLKDFVVKVCFCKSLNNTLLNLLLIVNEVEVTQAFKSALLDELFTGPVPDAKSV